MIDDSREDDLTLKPAQMAHPLGHGPSLRDSARQAPSPRVAIPKAALSKTQFKSMYDRCVINAADPVESRICQ